MMVLAAVLFAVAFTSSAGAAEVTTPLTAECHLSPEAAASLTSTGLAGKTIASICSMPGAELLPASAPGVTPADSTNCGGVLLGIFDAPKEGKDGHHSTR